MESNNVTDISSKAPGAFTPLTITVNGEVIEQKKLSTFAVKHLLNVRQKDESIPAIENQSWTLSQAFYGDDKHIDAVDTAIPFADLGDYFTNVLEFNRLTRTGTTSGESTATAETVASSTSPTSTVAS